MDLRCRKTTCKYNKDLTCMAKNVDITQKLVCKTFELDKGKEKQDFSKLIFSENPPKIADYRHLRDMCLKCNAKCLFNNEGACLANGITINASMQKEPKCMTYLKP